MPSSCAGACDTNPYILHLSHCDKTLQPPRSAGQPKEYNAPKPISSALKLRYASSHSRVRNLNQISSQPSGIDAGLHLTLKWDVVVLVDYRWLITGRQRQRISLEIHLHPLLLISICLQVYHSLSPPELASSVFGFSSCQWIKWDNPYLNQRPDFILNLSE